MTSERPRFPLGLTLAAVLVFAACCALGAWQLQRAAWKTGELKRIAALENTTAQPIRPVLARAAKGQDVTFMRVAVDCARGSELEPYALTTDNGEWIARARAFCRLDPPSAHDGGVGPYLGVPVDRGFLTSSRGATSTPATILPPPTHVEGVLYPLRTRLGFPNLLLVAERETPAPPGVTPAPYPDAAGNLEYVGSYAPTWFGLAVVALCFYAAMLWRRYHPKR
jgi:surfeit locus 1 family protein